MIVSHNAVIFRLDFTVTEHAIQIQLSENL